MIYLSASAIKDFLSCSKKYYYRRFKKSLAKEIEPFGIGNITHKVLEVHWNDKETALEYAKTLYNEYNKEHTLTLSVSSGDKIMSSIITYFDKFAWMCSEEDSIEEQFSVPFADDITLIGKFDRRTSEGILLDWKTSKSKSTTRSLQSDIQFILYEWAYKQLYGTRPSASYLASLTHGTLTQYNNNKQLELILFNEVIPMMVTSIKKNYYPPTGFFHYSQEPCYGCIFREVCHNELVSRNSFAKQRGD